MKKCSILSLGLFLSLQSFAAPSIETQIRSDLKKHQSDQFDPLLKKWEKSFGSKALQSLFKLAQDSKLSESKRYIALMAGAKIGRSEVLKVVPKVLKDRSWLLRSGGLKTLQILYASEKVSLSSSLEKQVLSLTQDPALIVRYNAVETISQLRFKEGKAALLSTLKDSRNFHHGKPQWVPELSLSALTHYSLTSSEKKEIKNLAQKSKHPDFKASLLKLAQ